MIKLGALYSQPDVRDYTLEKVGLSINPNEKVQETSAQYAPKSYDQGHTQQCWAYALSGIIEAMMLKETKIRTNFSKSFIFGNRRDSDYQGEGLVGRQAVKNLVNNGVVYNNDFPILDTANDCINALNENKSELFNMASPYRPKAYLKLNNVQEVYAYIEKYRLPVGVIFDVYENITDIGSDAIIPDPAGRKIGGHGVVQSGIAIHNDIVYARIINSWGLDWGVLGQGYLKVDYIKEAWALLPKDDILLKKEIDTVIIKTLQGKLITYSGLEIIGEYDVKTINSEGKLYGEFAIPFNAIGWEQKTWDNQNKIASFGKVKKVI